MKAQPWHSNEDGQSYKSLFPLLPNYVVQRTVGIRNLRVGLSKDVPDDLRSKILAALVSFRLGVELSYAEKRYVQPSVSSRWLGLTDRIDDIYEYGQSRLEKYAISLTQRARGNLQDLSAHFFYRNVGAFDASKRLSELGYLCEVATILRTALEQFALCARLWTAEESEKIKSIRALHSLNALKPYSPNAGKLYGALSKYTHFEYDNHTHFFAVSPEKNFTMRVDPILRAYATHLLFLTMACTSRYVLTIAPKQFDELPKEVLELKDFMSNIDRYSDDVCIMLPKDVVLAESDILLQHILK